jgi:hypothetical protein
MVRKLSDRRWFPFVTTKTSEFDHDGRYSQRGHFLFTHDGYEVEVHDRFIDIICKPAGAAATAGPRASQSAAVFNQELTHAPTSPSGV